MQNLLNRTKFAKLAGVNPSTVTRLSETLLKAAVVGKHIDANHPDAVKYLADRKRQQTPPAATGLDPLYEEAVTLCQKTRRCSISQIQRHLRIGFNRASIIVQALEVHKVVSTMNPNGTRSVLIGSQEEAEPEPEPPKTTKPQGFAAVKQKKKQQPPVISYEEGLIEIPEDIQTFAEMTLRELIEKFGTDVRFVDWLNATQKIEAINEKRLKNAQTKGDLISRELVRKGVIDVFNSAHLRLLKDGAKTIAAGVVSKQAAGAELSEIEAFVSDILGSFIKPVKNKISRALKDDK